MHLMMREGGASGIVGGIAGAAAGCMPMLLGALASRLCCKDASTAGLLDNRQQLTSCAHAAEHIGIAVFAAVLTGGTCQTDYTHFMPHASIMIHNTQI